MKKNVHLPDSLFVKYCNIKYGVNRGIYNTIDMYFFHKGVLDIINRRRKILSFLNFLMDCNGINEKGNIIIGVNRLSKRLNQFNTTKLK